MGGNNMDGKDFEHIVNDNIENETAGTSDIPEGCCGGRCGCSCRNDDYEGEIGVGGLLASISKTMTLQDIANCYLLFPDYLKSSFQTGDTQIWFKRSHDPAHTNIIIDVNNLNDTHVLLGSIAEKSLDMVKIAFTASGWCGGLFSAGSLHDMFLRNNGTDHHEIQSGDVVVVDGVAHILVKNDVNEQWSKIV